MPKSEAPEKPRKPYADFPLFPHATGRWAKKIRGKLVYFGPWDDPDEALAKYLDQRDDLQAGRRPRDKADVLTVRSLLNEFLTAKDSKLRSGELSPRTWNEYRQIADTLVDTFGRTRAVADLRPDDFRTLRDALARTLGPVALGNRVQRIRTVFKWGYDAGLIDAPVRFGPDFTKPSRKTMRLARHAAGKRMFEADEIRRLTDAAGQPMRAMILLGINAGFGPTDCATLTREAIDLPRGWLDYPRPKTGIARRVPLWPETVAALSEALPGRPKAKDRADDALAFLTRFGRAYVRNTIPKAKDADPSRFTTIDTLGAEFSKLVREQGIDRSGTGFYGLRRAFETVAGEAKDQIAVDAIMGHADESMAAVYRQGVSDERLRAVVDHVRAWLWPDGPTTPTLRTDCGIEFDLPATIITDPKTGEVLADSRRGDGPAEFQAAMTRKRR